MANKTIVQLPEQTGVTDNDVLAIVDSGETTTSKIKVSTLLASAGGGGSPLVQTIGASGENVDSNFSDGGTPFDPNGFDTDYDNLVVGWGNNQTGTANTTTRNNTIFGFDNIVVDNTTTKSLFGNNNELLASSYFIFGNNNTTNGQGIGVIGYNSRTTFNDNSSMAIGSNAEAANFNSVSIGTNAYANNRGTAIGNSTTSQGYGVAVGVGANCGGERNVVI